MTAVIGVKGQFSIARGRTRSMPRSTSPSRIPQPRHPRPFPRLRGRQGAGRGRNRQSQDDSGALRRQRSHQQAPARPGVHPAPAEGEGRLKQTITRGCPWNGARDQAGAAPRGSFRVPATHTHPDGGKLLAAYDDAEGRFHLLHPQELQVTGVYPEGGVDLLDRRPDGQDVLQITLVPKTGPGRATGSPPTRSIRKSSRG